MILSSAAIERLLRKSCSLQNPKDPNGNEIAMLLANMAKSDRVARLQSLKRKPVPDLTSSIVALDQLIELFNKGADQRFNAGADYDYLGHVFADMVRVGLYLVIRYSSVAEASSFPCS